MLTHGRAIRIAVALTALMLVAGCAAGNNNDWTDADPAGFFAGLWHGVLLIVALVVSFFTNDVTIYEVSNTGTAYNIGFVLGILAVSGSGTKISVCRPKKSKKKDEENWDKVAARVEAKVKTKLKGVLADDDDPEWKELGEKFERKLKDKLKKWLDEDGTPPSEG